MTSSDRNVCAFCGGELPPRRWIYCSDECMDAAYRLKRPVPRHLESRICVDCGGQFFGAARSFRCRPCQLIANRQTQKKAAAERQAIIASVRASQPRPQKTDKPPKPPKPSKPPKPKTFSRYGCIQINGDRYRARYNVDGKLKSIGVFDTLEEAADARVAAILARWPDAIISGVCIICGAVLPKRHKLQYCRKCQQKQRTEKGIWKRQWAEMTPEQRQRKYEQYRKNYRLRKERKAADGENE